jgi:hypothetical protein
MPPYAAEIVARHRKLARTLGWSFEKQACLAMALNTLDLDPGHGFDVSKAGQAWRSMTARGELPTLVAAARAAGGMSLTGSGTQTGYQDCALFALASATGRPYGYVGALASDLIRKGDWRDASRRSDPEHTMEAEGLSGGELVMLAEMLGQARTVAPGEFASAIKSGAMLLVRISPTAGVHDHGHEVVLTTAFTHEGLPWFEVLDSNRGPLRRMFATAEEIGALLLENGIAYQAERGRTPAPLR